MERMVHVDQLRPEICSLDVGSMNFGDMVFVSTVDHVKKMAAQIAAWGVNRARSVRFGACAVCFALGFGRADFRSAALPGVSRNSLGRRGRHTFHGCDGASPAERCRLEWIRHRSGYRAPMVAQVYLLEVGTYEWASKTISTLEQDDWQRTVNWWSVQ
jgi:hypothetical protein